MEQFPHPLCSSIAGLETQFSYKSKQRSWLNFSYFGLWLMKQTWDSTGSQSQRSWYWFARSCAASAFIVILKSYKLPIDPAGGITFAWNRTVTCMLGCLSLLRYLRWPILQMEMTSTTISTVNLHKPSCQPKNMKLDSKCLVRSPQGFLKGTLMLSRICTSIASLCSNIIGSVTQYSNMIISNPYA